MAGIVLGSKTFSTRDKELITELAFLRAFLAWESFLEESFLLYLLGKKPPKGRQPRRYAQPPTRKVAEELLIVEGRRYTDWTRADMVVERSQRFFRNGEPFFGALKSKQAFLEDVRTIRNAIAHSSKRSQQAYQRLVRKELATYSPSTTIGRFLSTPNPRVSPPESFFETYIASLTFVAETIVPC
jgi:hypothetical protein